MATETDFDHYEVWDVGETGGGYYITSEDSLGNIICDKKLATITDQGVGEYTVIVYKTENWTSRVTYIIYAVNKLGQRTPSNCLKIDIVG